MDIYTFDVVESTNDLARTHIIDRKSEPAAFVAKHQTMGRGRMCRVWKDEPGMNLLVSFALPGNYYANPPLVGMAAAVFIGEYLESLGLSWEAKWPNDVLINGKKVAGVLPEGIWQDTLQGIIVGIGLNVNQSEFPEEYPGTSIKKELQREVALEQPLTYLAKRMEQIYNQEVDYKTVVQVFKNRFALLGKQVKILSKDESWEGIASNINDDGSLLVATGGKWININWGEVTLR